MLPFSLSLSQSLSQSLSVVRLLHSNRYCLFIYFWLYPQNKIVHTPPPTTTTATRQTALVCYCDFEKFLRSVESTNYPNSITHWTSKAILCGFDFTNLSDWISFFAAFISSSSGNRILNAFRLVGWLVVVVIFYAPFPNVGLIIWAKCETLQCVCVCKM